MRCPRLRPEPRRAAPRRARAPAPRALTCDLREGARAARALSIVTLSHVLTHQHTLSLSLYPSIPRLCAPGTRGAGYFGVNRTKEAKCPRGAPNPISWPTKATKLGLFPETEDLFCKKVFAPRADQRKLLKCGASARSTAELANRAHWADHPWVAKPGAS